MSPYAGPLRKLLLTGVVGDAGQPLEHRSLLPLQGGFSLGQLSWRILFVGVTGAHGLDIAVFSVTGLLKQDMSNKNGFHAANSNLHAYPMLCILKQGLFAP